jgi:hypothetical protein
MVKPTQRTRSVGTKVTEEEYGMLEAAAGKQTMAEWAREALLKAAKGEGTAVEKTLLAEVLSLRKIVVNLMYELAGGKTPTPELMQKIIEHADAEKLEKAHARLASAGSKR